jgi:hypothetical protein
MKVILQAKANKAFKDIIIQAFPFLVGRNETSFLQYQDEFPDHLKKLSRNHARIFLKGDQLYVEDLGSTNGTFLGGERLYDRPMPLSHGDSIAFGAFFEYVVNIDQPETKPVGGQMVGERTIYMSDASSFLGMLSSEEKGKDGPPSTDSKDPFSQASTAAGATHSPLQDKKRLFAALIAEFWGKPGQAQKRKWYVLGFVGVLLVSILLGVVIYNSPERKLKRLMKQRRYAECSDVANKILRKNSNNQSVCDIATEALMKDILPGWTAKVKGSHFTEARELLAGATARNQHNPDGVKAIELLVWATDLEEFFAGRNSETSVNMFGDEAQIEPLLKRWNKDKDSNGSLLDQMSNLEPSFSVTQRQIYSHLNSLKTMETMRVEPTEELKEAIQKGLDADQPQALVSTIEDFQGKYPKIGGIGALQQDLAAYMSLWKALESKQLFEISKLLGEYRFQTKPFIDKVAHIRGNVLPSPEIMEAYRKASEAWSSGAPKKAIALMEPLTNEKWGELAMMKLEHYRQVLKDFATLEGSRDKSDYGTLLLSFHNLLIPGEDDVFLKLIDKDFEKVEKEELEKSQASLMGAQAYWDEYLKGGGISGLLRLDTKVSEEFRRKAGLLRSAFEGLSSGASTYGLLKRELPETWKTLQKNILEEVKTQRLRLNDLKNVLEPAVSSEKLKLLPNPLEEKD